MRALDLRGERFGMLLVIEPVGNSSSDRKWRCKCDCGEVVIRARSSLRVAKRRGMKSSCGCYAQKLRIKMGRANKTHGLCSHPAFHIWRGIMSRCYDPSNKSYANYGGRGIEVSFDWHDPSEFCKWADTSGYARGLSIERCNNNGPYSPGNCKWIPLGQQARNTRVTTRITIDGVTRPLVEWAELAGLSDKTIRSRLRLGWSQKGAVYTPSRKRISA